MRSNVASCSAELTTLSPPYLARIARYDERMEHFNNEHGSGPTVH